jgi:TolB-like protein/class 3 adenylate cyclase/tetratricopeptide (TPR) repeat protein
MNDRCQGCVERRLAAILAADVVGYSTLMERDEEGTFAGIRNLRLKIVEPSLARHRGRLIKTTGDGFLAEFSSPIEALRCALAIQSNLESEPGPLRLRVGLNLGDTIIEEGGDVFGEGVNVAARLEALAEAGGILISGKLHDEVEGKVEADFEYRGEQQVKNITRLVRIYAVHPRKPANTSAATIQASAARKQILAPTKPSIAVLPFQNMSGDPEQEYFADGMVEDIITALSHFKSLFVIARNSSFTYKGKPIDIKRVGRELGVRYLLEGSVRRSTERVRITGQLIDAATGAHLWADKFDGSLADVFELQDFVSTSVVGAIAARVDQAEMERVRRKPVENFDAHDCFLRGLAASTHTAGNPEKNDEALGFFYRAVELDPLMGCAYAMAALRYNVRKIYGWVVDREGEYAEARRLAENAVRFGEDDAMALSRAAISFSYFFFEHERAEALVDRSLAINPNLASAWQIRGQISLYLGQHEKALKEIDHAIRLNPIDPENYLAETVRAFALLLLGKYDEACRWADHVVARDQKYAVPLRIASVSHALSGRLDQARETMRQLREVDPALRLSQLSEVLPFRRPEDITRIVEGLRLAGLPE